MVSVLEAFYTIILIKLDPLWIKVVFSDGSNAEIYHNQAPIITHAHY